MEDAQKKKKIKIFVDKNNLATVICHSCGHAKQLDVTKFINLNKTLRCRCKCGKSFLCTLEFREYFRKKTKMIGHFTFLRDRSQHKIIVNDVSRKGINFSMLTVCDIKIGDILEVIFTLDDTHKTVICKQVEVKSVHNRLIGCYFTCPQWYDKELGFYLMNTDSRVKKSPEEL
ncbi:MAG: hypothetical protein LWW98_01270 [Deltaproteobacteria bacterium]|nr:hypothetical protein [Deltaproteobacteria bacterium]